MTKSPEKKFAIVKWRDHWSGVTEWTDFDDIKETCQQEVIITSIGFIAYEDSKVISLMGTCGDDQGSLLMTILKPCIITIKKFNTKEFVEN